MNEKKEKISCQECKKIIPKAAAVHAEGKDYVVHFCSIECLNYWQKKKKNSDK